MYVLKIRGGISPFDILLGNEAAAAHAENLIRNGRMDGVLRKINTQAEMPQAAHDWTEALGLEGRRYGISFLELEGRETVVSELNQRIILLSGHVQHAVSRGAKASPAVVVSL